MRTCSSSGRGWYLWSINNMVAEFLCFFSFFDTRFVEEVTFISLIKSKCKRMKFVFLNDSLYVVILNIF